LPLKTLSTLPLGHSGQKCSGSKALEILEAEVYDDQHFLTQLKDAVESIKARAGLGPIF
jgi:RHH-type proline utilization regulon transcriptional repressor/proline dehydrogenase/delta 1-pyrroline-5-carboxylate dehydrogenase